jgi:hypothetical protein
MKTKCCFFVLVGSLLLGGSAIAVDSDDPSLSDCYYLVDANMQGCAPLIPDWFAFSDCPGTCSLVSEYCDMPDPANPGDLLVVYSYHKKLENYDHELTVEPGFLLEKRSFNRRIYDSEKTLLCDEFGTCKCRFDLENENGAVYCEEEQWGTTTDDTYLLDYDDECPMPDDLPEPDDGTGSGSSDPDYPGSGSSDPNYPG